MRFVVVGNFGGAGALYLSLHNIRMQPTKHLYAYGCVCNVTRKKKAKNKADPIIKRIALVRRTGRRSDRAVAYVLRNGFGNDNVVRRRLRASIPFVCRFRNSHSSCARCDGGCGGARIHDDGLDCWHVIRGQYQSDWFPSP